jgi:hypothetical protein
MAGALGFLGLAVGCFLTARAMSRRKARALARLSTLAGLVVVLGFVGGPILGPAGLLGIWISVVVGWSWLAVVSRHLLGLAHELSP